MHANDLPLEDNQLKSLLNATSALQGLSDNQMVFEFHLHFGLPLTVKPRLLDADLQRFRIARLREELREYEEAVAAGDLAGAADALVDLAYIVHGTAHCHGLPWRPLMKAVHAANMGKVRVVDAADSKHGHAADIKKPPGWRAPDIEGVLREYGWKGAL